MGPTSNPNTARRDAAGWLACGLSEVGLVRTRNEDALVLDPELAAYILADGMGGHPGGDVASRLAVEAAHRTLRESAADLGSEAASGDWQRALGDAFRAARAAVQAEGRLTPDLAQMGTTLTMLALAGAPADSRAVYAHIGDSRLYALTGDGLRQVSEDHTVAAELVRAGALAPEDAERSLYWHTLSRVIVARRDEEVDDLLGAEPDLGTVELAGAEALLVCSDGLSNMVPDPDIERWLRAHPGDPAAAAQALLLAALAAGGVDNITLVVVMPSRNDGTGL